MNSSTKSINKRNIILTCVLVALLCISSIFAYLVWNEQAINIFTVGNLTLELSEPNWVEEDAQYIAPGTVLPKDPLITNTGDNAAYVFMTVDVPKAASVNVVESGAVVGKTDYELFSYTVNSGWKQIAVDTSNATVNTYTYVYGTTSACTSLASGAATPALFSTVKFANVVEGQNLGDGGTLCIVVNGYGIQTTGLSVTSPSDIFSTLMTQLADN